MRKVLVVLFLLLVPSTASAIVNGTVETDIDSVGAILDGAEVACTGVLIDAEWGITSASCFFDGETPRTTGLEFCVGDDIATCETAGIDAVAVHEGYDGTDHDIGVFHLADPIPGAETAQMRQSQMSVSDEGTPVTWVGFGSNTAGGDGIGVRRSGTGEILAVYLSEFATGTGAVQPCIGDTGGPAFQESGGATVISGLVSSGAANCTGPVNHVRVDAYAAWVADALANTDVPCDLTGGDCEAGEACAPTVLQPACFPSDSIQLGGECSAEVIDRLPCEDGTFCVPYEEGTDLGTCNSFCEDVQDCDDAQYCYTSPEFGGYGLCNCVDADDDGFCEFTQDCDDTDAAISPDADEICGNGVDENCNGPDDDVCPGVDAGTGADMGTGVDMGADADVPSTSSGTGDDGCCTTVDDTGATTPLWAVVLLAGMIMWRRRR